MNDLDSPPVIATRAGGENLEVGSVSAECGTVKRRRPKWVRALLRAYSQCGKHYESAERAGITHDTAMRWRKEHPENQAEVDAAREKYAELLEREADRRGIEGVNRKKFDRNGKPVIDPATNVQYEEREYSDTLLIFRLKALKPEEYRERRDVTSGGESLGDAMARVFTEGDADGIDRHA